jgi:hypothetical protein
MADGGAAFARIQSDKHRAHIIGIARGKAEPADIEHQPAASLAHLCGQATAANRTRGVRKLLGDGGGGGHPASFAARADRNSEKTE